MLTDGVAILAFAAIGRLSHAEGVTAGGVLEGAWPFLAGGALGTLVGRTWRHPTALRSGAAVWAGTLAGGMLLRALTGGGVQLSFVIVAGLVLAAFMVGWRAALRLVGAVRSPISRQRGTSTPV